MFLSILRLTGAVVHRLGHGGSPARSEIAQKSETVGVEAVARRADESAGGGPLQTAVENGKIATVGVGPRGPRPQRAPRPELQ